MNTLRYDIINLYDKLRYANVSAGQAIKIFASIGVTLIILAGGTLSLFFIEEKAHEPVTGPMSFLSTKKEY
jgi:hypothetical protein